MSMPRLVKLKTAGAGMEVHFNPDHILKVHASVPNPAHTIVYATDGTHGTYEGPVDEVVRALNVGLDRIKP